MIRPDPNDPPADLYACEDCGCTDVRVMAWTHANTGAVVGGDVGGDDSYWCPRCDASKSSLQLVVTEDPHIETAYTTDEQAQDEIDRDGGDR